METERFPADILEQLERDMDGTLPTLRLYVRGSPMRDDLREFICAWVVYRSDEGLGYVSMRPILNPNDHRLHTSPISLPCSSSMLLLLKHSFRWSICLHDLV